MPSPGNRAFTLVEAVISSFLLLTAVSMAIWVFDASLRAGAENDRRVLAAQVAQNKMEEIRAFAATGFAQGLASYNGVTTTPPEAPTLQVLTRVTLKTLCVPCTSLESQYPTLAAFPTPSQKALQSSAWQVEVQVSWDALPGDQVTLVSYVADWRPVANYTVQISPAAPQTVASQGTINFTATATDGSGNPLPDLIYTWYTISYDGIGSIAAVSRDGRQCQYQNNFRYFNGTYGTQPGRVDVQARGVYRGVVQTASVQVTNQ